MAWEIYDYIDSHGNNDVQRWFQKLQTRDRARLNSKLDMLMRTGPDLAPRLLSDTTDRSIKKIRVNGNVALRPMLCRGPINNDLEYTLLIGATEKDRKRKPRNAIEQAGERRTIIINDPTRRINQERV